jgi:hypothetical protein
MSEKIIQIEEGTAKDSSVESNVPEPDEAFH